MKEEKIRKFGSSIHEGYEEYAKNRCPLLDKFTKLQKTRKRERRFKEVLLRIKMEKEDFEPGIDNSILGRQLGENLRLGEFKEMIRTLKRNVKKESEEIHCVDDFKEIIMRSSNIRPTYALIPINNKVWHLVHKLVDEGLARYEGTGELVINLYGRIRVIWSNKYVPFDEIYLIGEDAMQTEYKLMYNKEKMTGYKEFFDKENSRVSMSYKNLEGGAKEFLIKSTILIVLEKKRIKRFKVG